MTRSVESVDRGSKKGIKKKEVLKYAIINKASVPSIQPSTSLQPKVEYPLPST
jgi:hypothetical protein